MILTNELLQEHRTALISAAVTGQIDVRGLAETEAALGDTIPVGSAKSDKKPSQIELNASKATR